MRLRGEIRGNGERHDVLVEEKGHGLVVEAEGKRATVKVVACMLNGVEIMVVSIEGREIGERQAVLRIEDGALVPLAVAA